MGQCLGVDRLRQDIDRQKKELRTSVTEVDKLKKEIADLRNEIERSTKEISEKLDDWVLKSKKNDKDRIMKEMENQSNITDAKNDVIALRSDLRRLQGEFQQYKKDNTTILVALDKALEKRMTLQRINSSDNVIAAPPNTEKLQHHHSYHSSSHHHQQHHHHHHENGARNTDDLDNAFPLVPQQQPQQQQQQPQQQQWAQSSATNGVAESEAEPETKLSARTAAAKSKFATAGRAVQLQNTAVRNLVQLNQEDIAANNPTKMPVPTLNLTSITGDGVEESKANNNNNAPVPSVDGPALHKLTFTIAMTDSGFGFVLRSLKSYQTAWFEPIDNGKTVTRMCVKDWRVFEDGKNPAEVAGVRIGDILEEVEGRTFSEVNEMLTALKETASKKSVTIALWRRE